MRGNNDDVKSNHIEQQPMAIAAAKEMPSHRWWMSFGSQTPELQNVAVKVLSQVTSAGSCERNWSTFEFIHSKKARNTTNWHVLQSGTLLRFTVTYVSLTTLKRSGIAMPTSTGLLPMKTWIDWLV